jgi:hypothetical protein
LIKDVVAKARKDERVLIAACGPEGLMWSVRTAAGCITVGGVSGSYIVSNLVGENDGTRRKLWRMRWMLA